MKHSSTSHATRLGILGGGQLAWMLGEAARGLGLEPLVLAASVEDPAVVAGLPRRIGRLDDSRALDDLLGRVDVLTIENEFLDIPVLERALARHPAVRFHPKLDVIGRVQDKLQQKRLFRDLGIPTAEFEVLGTAPGERGLSRLLERYPGGVVLKWSRFGYDGRGNFVVDPDDVGGVAAVRRFWERGRERGAEIYAEAKIDFRDEVALVSARGLDATLRHLPLVTTRQERGVCREVRGPSVGFGLPSRLEREAREAGGRLAEALDYVGAFAVEYFVDGHGRLLANEMAPRVHNSGHYSWWPGDESQFDLHVRAVMGLPFASLGPVGLVLMRNVLGPGDLVGKVRAREPAEAPPAGTRLAWYGKRAASRGRKMGHLTARAPTVEAARELSARMASWEARYWASCRTETEVEDVADRQRTRRHRDGFVFGLARDERSGRRAG